MASGGAPCSAPAPPGVTVGCLWLCAPPGGLDRALCLRRGASRDEASGEAVALERRAGGGDAACVLQLQCRAGAERVAAVGVVSEARHMEVYVGEEYCGTGRGVSAGILQPPGETETVTLYEKYLKLECPATSCRIKLLSIGEKQRVLISKIIVQLNTVSAKLATDFPSLGSSIDLDRVQTIMESMGSKLSPGAQQLMDMVRYQQKQNSLPLGDKLSWMFGKSSDFGNEHPVDGFHGAAIQTSLHQSVSESSSVRNPATSETGCENVNPDLKAQLPEGRDTSNSTELNTQQNTVDLRNDFKAMGSLLMQEQTDRIQNVAAPQMLLPFLQNLCSQVNHLRLKGGEKHLDKNVATKEEGIQTVGVEQQPICSYLEKIISKNMDLMEKKLTDYIDRQIQALQAHIDDRMVLLMDLLQNSKQNKISQAHYDSNEGFSNGER
ncbi:ATPase PAAT isoform X1 [Tympanuchus pallidicinctus]|uniref:ATPase PAAT isoform X1 n=1 Tax=Tympanuchus pallidicinctus TaxID=109042 RepID=UPI0022870A65|nr:ATPase PAAT isoform X1 [Tympanuchus pallidicinctus]